MQANTHFFLWKYSDLRPRRAGILSNCHPCNKHIMEVYKLGLSLGCFRLLVCLGWLWFWNLRDDRQTFPSLHSQCNLINISVESPVWGSFGQSKGQSTFYEISPYIKSMCVTQLQLRRKEKITIYSVHTISNLSFRQKEFKWASAIKTLIIRNFVLIRACHVDLCI